MSTNTNMNTNAMNSSINSANSAINSVSNVSDSSIESSMKSSVSPADTNVKLEEDDMNEKFDMPTKMDVVDTINNSEDLSTAVESVAAMYMIPSSHIMEDPDADRITVRKGHIIVPSNTHSKPSDNGKAIVQSIGALLDYISQRVDNKMNKFQADNIQSGVDQEKIDAIMDPSRGKILASQMDANGEPVVIYDSGYAHMSNTPEARKTYDEMCAMGKREGVKSESAIGGYSYFTPEEDDITYGIDMNFRNNEGEELNVSDEIKEESFILDMIGERGNTRHLGYDIMQEQGFDFVKPVDFFTESETTKKNRAKTAFGVEHMKFDNTNLIKAIKFMNEARKEQNAKRGSLDLERLINSPKYQKAIDCLNKQFNARLNIRFLKTEDGINREATAIYNDIKTKLVISKSKGFQLGGLPIDIFVVNSALDEDAPDDSSLFGQHVISVFCHEIFHNIMAVLKSKESQFTAALAETMMLAKDIPSASNRRKLVTNFVNTFDEFGGIKLNIFTKRAIIKHLTYLSTICHDENSVKEYENAIRDKKSVSIDDQIKIMEKKVRKLKIKTYGPGRYFIPAALTIGSLVGLSAASTAVPAFAIFFGINSLSLFGTAVSHAIEINAINKLRNGTIKNYEEHWCDMFAACYNLPVTFFLSGSKSRNGVANDYTIDILKHYDELERDAMQMMMVKYPTINERNQAAVKYAKQTLASKAKLDPSIKKYLEWIVTNYSKTLDIDIDEIYSKGTFDPKTAEDLDGHIEKLIGSANINVTESDISWLNDIDDSVEYL